MAFVFPLLLAISFLTWIFSASLSSRFTSCRKKRYPFQHSLSLVWMAFLCQRSLVFMSCFISGVTNGWERDLIFIRLMGACWSSTSKKRELNVSTWESMSSKKYTMCHGTRERSSQKLSGAYPEWLLVVTYLALTLGRLIFKVTSTKLWSLIEDVMTEQASVIMTSSNERFVSVIVVGSFTSCVKLKLAQSSLRVWLSTVSSRMLQFRSPKMIISFFGVSRIYLRFVDTVWVPADKKNKGINTE